MMGRSNFGAVGFQRVRNEKSLLSTCAKRHASEPRGSDNCPVKTERSEEPEINLAILPVARGRALSGCRCTVFHGRLGGELVTTCQLDHIQSAVAFVVCGGQLRAVRKMKLGTSDRQLLIV